MSGWDKKFITYEEFGIKCDRLCEEVNGYSFSCIYGPKLGAWPIVAHVARHLNIPVYDNLCLVMDDDHLLLVDDVCDTGKTFTSMIRVIDCAFVSACIYYKPWSKYKPDVYVEQTQDWLVWPWETADTEINRSFPG